MFKKSLYREAKNKPTANSQLGGLSKKANVSMTEICNIMKVMNNVSMDLFPTLKNIKKDLRITIPNV